MVLVGILMLFIVGGVLLIILVIWLLLVVDSFLEDVCRLKFFDELFDVV